MQTDATETVPTYPFISRFGLLFFCLIGGIAIGQLLVEVLLHLCNQPGTIEQIKRVQLGDKDSVFWVILLQVFNQIAGFAAAACLVYFYTDDKFFNFKRVKLKYWFFLPVLILLSFFVCEWISFTPETFSFPDFLKSWEYYFESVEAENEALLLRLLPADAGYELAFRFLVFAIIPAICEELFFRGALLGILSKFFSRHWAVWISAFIFSLFHFQAFGFFARWLMGGVLGYFRIYSGNLFLSIFAHLLFNAGGLLFFYLIPSFPNSILEMMPFWMSGGIMVMFILSTFLYLKSLKINHPNES